MLSKTLLLTAVACVGVLQGSARAVETAPPGISVRMSMLGPFFAGERGMTLYQREYTACPDHPETVVPLENVGYNQVEEFPMLVPDAALRRSCTDKYPPFVAPAGSKSVGSWTIHVRENGVHQWAYRGKPLHYARKDKLPGQHNARIIVVNNTGGDERSGWKIAAAPLEAPAGIQTRLTSLGLALANHEGKTLYYGGDNDKGSRADEWRPLTVAIAATAEHLPMDWSIILRADGLRQWAWKKNPLYTYARDSGDKHPEDILLRQFVDIFGETYGKPKGRWQVALLKAASAPPPGVRAVEVNSGAGMNSNGLASNKIYADAKGHTLYMMSCVERTKDRLDCDDVGDSPRYWLSCCGGEVRCMSTWRILSAPANARPIDNIWWVAVVNPRNPYKPLRAGEAGVPVWTYQGRFVFTYAADRKPGQTFGFTHDYQGMLAEVIPAFATP